GTGILERNLAPIGHEDIVSGPRFDPNILVQLDRSFMPHRSPRLLESSLRVHVSIDGRSNTYRSEKFARPAQTFKPRNTQRGEAATERTEATDERFSLSPQRGEGR